MHYQVITPFDEFRSNLREHGAAEYVLFCLCDVTVLLLNPLKLRFQQIGRPTSYRLRFTDCLFPNLFIHGSRKFSVFTAKQAS